jgi:hypothetical protein
MAIHHELLRDGSRILDPSRASRLLRFERPYCAALFSSLRFGQNNMQQHSFWFASGELQKNETDASSLFLGPGTTCWKHSNRPMTKIHAVAKSKMTARFHPLERFHRDLCGRRKDFLLWRPTVDQTSRRHFAKLFANQVVTSPRSSRDRIPTSKTFR